MNKLLEEITANNSLWWEEVTVEEQLQVVAKSFGMKSSHLSPCRLLIYIAINQTAYEH